MLVAPLSAAAISKIPPGRALLARPGLIDDQVAAVDVLAVESIDGPLSLPRWCPS